MSQFNLSFSPLLPWPVLLGLGVIALGLVGLGFYARGSGSFLRALGLGLLVLAMPGPALVREDRNPLKEIVAVVVDQSGSQTIGERPAQTEKARAGLEKSLNALGNVEVRVIESGRTDSEADGTRLFTALNAGLADVPLERLGGVFMITDGVVDDVPADVSALGFKAPLHALITGHAGERDRRIELLEAPRFGIVGKDQTIELRVLDTADNSDPVVLKVRRDGNPVATIVTTPGERLRVPVKIEHGGPNVVELEVEALPDELTAINNKAVLTIEGVRDKLKVLLVSGEPHAGERMWRNLLKSDANVDLVHFTILRPPEKQDGTPINELSLIAFPTRELFQQRINEFQLIIFDRYARQGVLPLIYLDNVAKYVRNGGAVLVAAGPDYASNTSIWRTPLGSILPAEPVGVTEKPYYAHLSDAGKRHPVTRGLEGSASEPPHWSRFFRTVDTRNATSPPVMTGADGKPLLLLSRFGEGRVALLLSDHIWLWARGYEGGGPHLDLLRRVSHWLMKQPDLDEEALRLQVQGHDLVVLRQTMADSVTPVTVTSPSGATRELTLSASEPGMWRSTIPASELGLWQATDGTLKALINVGPTNPKEFAEVTSTTDMLKPLAQATGGDATRVADGGSVSLPRIVAVRASSVFHGDGWMGVKMRDASVVKGVGVLTVFAGLIGLLLLLGGFAATWLREGR